MNALRPHLKTIVAVVGALVIGYLLLRRPTQTVTVAPPTGTAAPAAVERTYEIVTLLPRDAIPAIDDPQFYPAAEADAEYAPDELVLGVSLDGESRAYSTSLLDRHEIVNDTVGGRKIAVTW